jgi:3-deoxy-D-manno-octulosonate 8-phosphate phosphatase (KDO 8-P phosphatase)
MNNIELFKEKAAKIKLVATDIDGTLTDGSLYVTESGEISKKFSFKDIMGLSRLRKNGYIVAIISGEKSKIIDLYALKLQIEDVYQGTREKKECLEALAQKYKLTMKNICYIGDDINDIPALISVGLPVVVNNANYKVKNIEGIFITDAPGGQGAFRELSDLLIPEEVPAWQ